MTPTQNGLTAGNSQPAKNTFKQGANSTAATTKSVAHPACTMSGTGHKGNQLNPKPVQHYAGAIIAPGADNTKGIAVATPTESGVLSRLNSGTRMHCGCYGFWQDGPYRKAGRTAIPVLSTSCALNALDKAFAGFQSRIGATMFTDTQSCPATGHTTSTPTQSTGTSHTTLSFVKVEHRGKRNQRLTHWFAVPDEDYCTGNATGYRVTAELMAWVQSRPSNYATGMIVREVMAAAFAVLAEPCTPHKPDRRGCAVSFLDAMAAFLMFAAQRSNHQAYLAGKAQRSEDWARESAQMDAERNRQTGQRLAAARRAKRAARMAEGEVAV